MAPLLKHNSELLFIDYQTLIIRQGGWSPPPQSNNLRRKPIAGHELVAMNGTQRLLTSTESTSGLANAPFRESSGILGTKAIEANSERVFLELMVTRP